MSPEPVKFSALLLTRERIMADYKDVFEGLGHKGESSTFVIDPNHPPVQHAPRLTPVILLKRSQGEDRRLLVWSLCQSQEK